MSSLWVVMSTFQLFLLSFAFVLRIRFREKHTNFRFIPNKIFFSKQNANVFFYVIRRHNKSFCFCFRLGQQAIKICILVQFFPGPNQLYLYFYFFFLYHHNFFSFCFSLNVNIPFDIKTKEYDHFAFNLSGKWQTFKENKYLNCPFKPVGLQHRGR